MLSKSTTIRRFKANGPLQQEGLYGKNAAMRHFRPLVENEQEFSGWVNPGKWTDYDNVTIHAKGRMLLCLREDRIKVKAKAVEVLFQEEINTWRKYNQDKTLSRQDREILKARAREKLLSSTPPDTTLALVIVNLETGEVWLKNTTTRIKKIFTDLFERTFLVGLTELNLVEGVDIKETLTSLWKLADIETEIHEEDDGDRISILPGNTIELSYPPEVQKGFAKYESLTEAITRHCRQMLDEGMMVSALKVALEKNWEPLGFIGLSARKGPSVATITLPPLDKEDKGREGSNEDKLWEYIFRIEEILSVLDAFLEKTIPGFETAEGSSAPTLVVH